MRRVMQFLILILIFLIISSNVTLASQELFTVANTDDFYKLMPYAVNQNIPIVIEDPGDLENLNHFAISSDFYIKPMTNSRINSLLMGANSDTLLLVAINNQRMVAFASLISAELNIPLIYDKDLDEFLATGRIKNIIVLGLTGKEIPKDINTTEYSGESSIWNFYKSTIIRDNLCVYVRSMNYCPMGAYLAAYRKGLLLVDGFFEGARNKSYFGLVVDPEDIANHRFGYNDNLDSIYTDNYRGVGIITGRTLQDANLLLLRSFYYRFNSTYKYLKVSDDQTRKNKSITKDNATYVVYNGKSTTVEEVMHEAIDSQYIHFSSQDSSTRLRINNLEITPEDLPMLNSSIVTAATYFESNISSYPYIPSYAYTSNVNFALEAIHQGAIAYIGNINSSAALATNFTGLPYLISSPEMPLSCLPVYHAQKIIKYGNKLSDVFMIGDPMWGMFENIGQWVGDKFEFNLSDTFSEKVILPLMVNDKDYQSAVISGTKNLKKEVPLDIVNIGAKRTAFIVTDQTSGSITLKKDFSLIVWLRSAVENYLAGARVVFRDLFRPYIVLMIFLINLITIIVKDIKSFYLKNINVLIALVNIILLLIVIDYFLLNNSINLLSYLIYTALFYILLNQETMLKGFSLFNSLLLIFVIPFVIMLRTTFLIVLNMFLVILTLNIIGGLFWLFTKKLDSKPLLRIN